jgi:hypothetical protein
MHWARNARLADFLGFMFRKRSVQRPLHRRGQLDVARKACASSRYRLEDQLCAVWQSDAALGRHDDDETKLL